MSGVPLEARKLPLIVQFRKPGRDLCLKFDLQLGSVLGDCLVRPFREKPNQQPKTAANKFGDL